MSSAPPLAGTGPSTTHASDARFSVLGAVLVCGPSLPRSLLINTCTQLLSTDVPQVYVLHQFIKHHFGDNNKVVLFDRTTNTATPFDFVVVLNGPKGLNSTTANRIRRMQSQREKEIDGAQSERQPVPRQIRCLDSELLLRAWADGLSGFAAIERDGMCFTPEVSLATVAGKHRPQEKKQQKQLAEGAIKEREEELRKSFIPATPPPSNTPSTTSTPRPPMKRSLAEVLEEVNRISQEPPPTFTDQASTSDEVQKAEKRFRESIEMHRQYLEDLHSENATEHIDQVMNGAKKPN